MKDQIKEYLTNNGWEYNDDIFIKTAQKVVGSINGIPMHENHILNIEYIGDGFIDDTPTIGYRIYNTSNDTKHQITDIWVDSLDDFIWWITMLRS